MEGKSIMYSFGKKRLESRKEIQKLFEEEKYNNKQYLIELQSILDRLDNIKNEELKLKIIGKIHRLESIICTISINLLDELTNTEKNKGKL